MKKILVVEDNDLLRENIVEILELEGFDVSEAMDGNDGVNKALENTPELIISDVNMPNKDGFEMLNELRLYDETKVTPFIFLTVKNTMRDIRDGMNLGADDYITKPFDMQDLVTTVHKRLDIRNKIVAKEVDKYDKLQNSVGNIISTVIDEPLKSLERLSSMLKTESSNLQPAEISEISKLICEASGKLRNEITHILFYHKTQALKDIPTDLATLKSQVSENINDDVKSVSLQVAKSYHRINDLSHRIEPSKLRLPNEFLLYIIRELVDNAFKYSPRNTQVKVTGIKEDQHYNIIIQDQGIGFPKKSLDDYQPYIGHSDSGSESDGLGLSLYNIKNLVELFDGKINVSSEKDAGTSFTVALPLA